MTPHRTRIKFCGMQRRQDIDAAVELGVDAVGLIFASRSARRLTPEEAFTLVAGLPPLVAKVTLFMDNDAALVREAIAAVRPQWLQFHGAEPDSECASFGLPFLKAVPMGRSQDGQQVEPRRYVAGYPSASGFVLDAHATGDAGGSGKRFDWSQVPALDRPWLLAGGLGPDNVADAIATLHPYAVDVSSGIESAVGAKNHEHMRRFVAEVRRADEQSR